MSELKTNLEQILQEKNEKIISQNIKKDIEVLGVTGSYDKEDIKELQDELADAEQELADVRRDLDNSTATISGSGETVTLNGTAEARFKKAPLPLGNTEQEVIEAQAGTTVEGESISASGVDLSKVEILNINGNTKQQTTTGKNLLPNNITSQNINGLQVIKNSDGTLLINGTATSQTSLRVATNLTLNSGTYYLSGNIGGSSTTYRLYAPDFPAYDDGTGKQFTLNSQTSSNVILLIFNNVTMSNVLIKPMIEEGSTATDYEPYTGGKASPNPDYPQEAYSAGANMNLFDKNNVISNAYLDSNGNEAFDGVWNITDYIPIISNKVYSYNGITTPGVAPYSAYYDSNKNFISSFKQAIGKNSIIVPSNAAYVRFSLAARNTDPIFNDLDTFKFEKGDKATAYSAYNQGNMNVEISNKNLWNGELEQNAWNNSDGTTTVWSNQYIRSKSFIEVKSNTIYTLNYSMLNNEVKNGNILLYDKDKNFINSLQTPNNLTFTTSSTTKYLKFNFYAGAGASIEGMSNLQLEQSSTATAYVAHEGQSITIPTQAPFREINNVKDTFVKKVDGKWYEKHIIREVVLDGTENWIRQNFEQQYYFRLASDIPAQSSSLCNYFNVITSSSTLLSFTNAIRINGTNIDIVLDKSEMSLENFKTWLSTHNVIVNYVLATPTYTECTQEQSEILDQINTFYETTNIFSTDEVSPNFTFTYNKVYASPSPDDESPVQTVSGDVEVKVQNKNLLKPDDFAQKVINSPYNAGNISTYDSETGALDVMMGKESIGTILNDFKENTRYTIIFKYKRMNTSDLNSNISIQYTDGTVYDFVLPNENGVLKYITTNNKTVSKIYHTAKNSGGTRTLYLKESGIFEGVLNEIDFILYKEQVLPLALKSKNLFDGEIELGSINPVNGELQPSTWRTRSKNFMKVKPNTTYTVSVQTGQYRWIVGYTADKIGITDGNVSGQASALSTFPVLTVKTNTFTTTATTEYIKWYDTSSTDLVEKVQIEEGSTATSYEPYYNYELCKIGDYQDYFWKDETTNKWYLHKEFAKLVIDENSNVGVSVSQNYSTCYYGVQLDVAKTTNESIGYSNYFKFDYSNSIGKTYFTASKYLYFIMDSSITNATTLKNWLSTHNVLVYYPLAEAINTEITDTILINQLEAIRKAISYDEQTNVSSNTIALFDIIALRNMNTILNTLENDVDLLE